MKPFLASVFGAVLAGLLIFFAQSWWSDRQTDNNFRLRFDTTANFKLSRKELASLTAKSGDYQDANLNFVKVTNIGREDLSDKSFSLPSDSVWDYGSIVSPNDNPNNAALKFDGKVLTVKYKLFPKDATHTFWFATGLPMIVTDFKADSAGTRVYSTADRIEDENPFPWFWFAGGAALLIVFIFGMGAGHTSAVQELAKKGHDYAALTSPPPSPPMP